MNRIELINRILLKRDLRRYLEIGCAGNRTFNAINAEIKVGVDPVRGGTIRATSDDFFQDSKEKFDLVFIDGLHLCEQVLRDVRNSLKILTPNGVIIVHDCLPRQESHQWRQAQRGAWTGDVWKAIVELRQDPDCDTVVLNADWGLGVVLPRRNSAPLRLLGSLSWSRYQRQRDELLRVVDETQLFEFLRSETGDAEIAPQILRDDATNSAPRTFATAARPDDSLPFVHVIVTRFNIGNSDTEWLRHRTELFERFTLLSMRAQSNQSFDWLLVCNAATPEPWRTRLMAYENGNTRIIWVGAGGRSFQGGLVQIVRDHIESLKTRQRFSHVISTRIDNDDAVHSEFVNQIQLAARCAEREFLNFPKGYVWFRGQVLLTGHESNSFISCVEPATDLRTVHCEQHGKLRTVAPVRQIAIQQPYWIRVCHDRNRLNRPPQRGEWCNDDVVPTAFAFTRESNCM